MHKLLIVDDRDLRRGDMAWAAQEAGLSEIIEACHEQEAHDRVAAERFDMAVIDVMLSCQVEGLEGLRVIERLHRQQPWCKIVALSASRDTSIGVQALVVGADDFISASWPQVNWVSLLQHRLELWSRLTADPADGAGAGTHEGPAI